MEAIHYTLCSPENNYVHMRTWWSAQQRVYCCYSTTTTHALRVSYEASWIIASTETVLLQLHHAVIQHPTLHRHHNTLPLFLEGVW